MKLFIVGLLVTVIDGNPPNVETEKTVTALLGGNVTFNCTSHFKDIVQVTWQRLRGQSKDNIATFSEKNGAYILESFSDRAAFIQSKLQVSTLAVSGVMFEDEGCYKCIFTTFLAGHKTGTTCLIVVEKDVNVETQNITAVLGGNVTFSCTSYSKDIQQVTWQKLNGQSEDNIATFSETNGGNFSVPFSGRAVFKPTKVQVSTIILSGVRLEDEGCYHCIFNTTRTGQNIGKTCLTLRAHISINSHHYIWIVVVLVAILTVVFVFSCHCYKKIRCQLRCCQHC
ncbi:nectin-1-like isoform X1 [Chiloscyllium plagiosum]|uniref:nectin-1-like isoform X1 n=1 Tax=Chiloscyllium plagiosum TaxID=36176 RepID=UPI001CB838A2|nr:nectin-1-like isoform X1 [Chiloscyllium plagiosum]